MTHEQLQQIRAIVYDAYCEGDTEAWWMLVVIDAALAAPEQEPVAWLHKHELTGYCQPHPCQLDRIDIQDGYTQEPLYPRPMPEPAAPEPVAIGEYLGAKKDDCGEREECVTWKPIEAGTPLYTTPPSLKSAQPVDYLCDGARFKLSFDEKGKTHMLSGFKAELQGQWVALVDATDNRHMKAVAPVPAPQREWQGLTAEQVNDVRRRFATNISVPYFVMIYNAIEAALRAKNEVKP